MTASWSSTSRRARPHTMSWRACGARSAPRASATPARSIRSRPASSRSSSAARPGSRTFLSSADKEYVADVRLGLATETYDAQPDLDRTGARPPTDRNHRGHDRGRRSASSAAPTCRLPPAYLGEENRRRRRLQARAPERGRPTCKPVPVTVHEPRRSLVRTPTGSAHASGRVSRAASTCARWRTTSGARSGCGASPRARCGGPGPGVRRIADAVPLEASKRRPAATPRR